MINTRVWLALLMLAIGVLVAAYLNSSDDALGSPFTSLTVLIDTERKRAVLHAILFFLCGFLLMPMHSSPFHMILVAVFLFAVGITIEVVQFFYANNAVIGVELRDSSIDLVVNVIGTLAGITFARLLDLWRDFNKADSPL